jgi:hypothetical protein
MVGAVKQQELQCGYPQSLNGKALLQILFRNGCGELGYGFASANKEVDGRRNAWRFDSRTRKVRWYQLLSPAF